MKKLIRKIKWKKLIKFLIFIAVIAVAGIFAYQHFFAKKATTETTSTGTAQKVEIRTIQNVLSGSGTIQPLNTYDVTTLVEGKIIAADFEEGDTIKKGQILYKVSTDDVDSQIDTSQTKVERAEESVTKAKKTYTKAVEKYDQAVADYKEAKEKYGVTDVKSTQTGIVKTLFVEVGDTVQNGAQIAQIYDNSYMLLTVPFAAADAKKSLVGKTAEVTITDGFETLQGKVTKVSSIDEALSGNRVVRQVTIKVKNPGSITSSTSATATIGSVSSTSAGTFAVLTDKVITSEVSGEIGDLCISEGDKIKTGDIIFSITKDSVSDQLKSYSNAVDSAKDAIDNANEGIETAKENLEDAKSSLEDTVDSKTDYSITAPISGKIVSKTALVGDTIKSQSASSSSLCTIYDLSAVTFSMYVDELDIKEVEVGDEVNVTADALDGVNITGKVINISLISNASSGVTQYPVTVQIDDVGDLLPGMNVTGNIVIEEAENCIAIPSDALMRGNIVYVKDDSASADSTTTDSTKTGNSKNNSNDNSSADSNTNFSGNAKPGNNDSSDSNNSGNNMPGNNSSSGNNTNSGNNNSTDNNSSNSDNNNFTKGANRDVPDGYKAVTVETGITDGDYVQVTSGLDGTEEVYVKRNISTESASQEDSLLDGLGLGGNSNSRDSMRGNWSGGAPGGNFGGGNMGNPGMPSSK